MSDPREPLQQIEFVLADMLDAYAEIRSNLVVPEQMGRLRERIAEEVRVIRWAALLVRHHRLAESANQLPESARKDWDAQRRAASERLDEFLVVPRSDIDTEFGIQYRHMVFGGIGAADVASRRAVEQYDLTPAAVRSRQVWKSPWSPLHEEVPDGA